MSRTGNKGFTFVEAMVASAVLALGVIFVFEGITLALNSFEYYAVYSRIAPWLDEQVWLAQDAVSRTGGLDTLQKQGEVELGGRRVTWLLSQQAIDTEQGLYQVDVEVFWKSGKKDYRFLRSVFARYGKR